MDLRSLLDKLETIDSRQLLNEADDVFEALTGLQYADVEALARTLPPPQDDARAAKLGELARKYNLPGLFDPFTNNFVNSDGRFAKIGAYSSEVDVLKSKGLLPLGAKTSNWGMGQDQTTAQTGNLSAQAVLQKAYRADAIMDKALPKLASAVNIAPPTQQPAAAATTKTESVELSGMIAQTLLEEFGYIKKAIAEAINRAEHKELKQIIADLTPYQGSIHQVGEVMALYKSYVRERDRLITEIMRLIARLKKRAGAKPAAAPTPAPTAPKAGAEGESGTAKNESFEYTTVKINLTEGAMDQWLYHSGTRDKDLAFINSRTQQVYTVGTIMENIDGQKYMLVEDSKSKTKPEPTGGVLQAVDDTVRGIANAWTGGWGDNVEARLNSWINGTTYGAELKKSIARTDAASKRALVTFTDPIFKKTWSPSMYDIGTGIGAATAFPAFGFVKTAALIGADIAQEKYLREPHNKKYTDKADKETPTPGNRNQGGMGSKDIPFDQGVKDIQDQLIAIYGGAEKILPKYKNDGRLGDETKTAIERAVKDGYTLVDKKIVKAQTQVAPTTVTNTNRTNNATNSTPSADTSVFGNDTEVVSQLQQALGTKVTGTVSQSDLDAFKEYVKKSGGDAYTALSKLIGATITEGTLISEAGGKAAWDFITKLFTKGAEKTAGGAERATASAEKVTPKMSELPGTVHKAKPGNPNYNAQRGEKSVASDGKTYERDIDGKWWEVGGVVKNGKPTYRPASAEIQKELGELSAKKGQDFNALMNSFVKGEKLAPEASAALEKGIASKFGEKAAGAWRSAVAKGGKFLQFAKNRKWLLAFLLLAAGGYLIWRDNNETDDQGGMAAGNTGAGNNGAGNNGAGSTTATDPTQSEEYKEDLAELVQLLNELVGGWPDDVETANTLKSAAEVGASPSAGEGGSGQGGMSVQGQSTDSRVLNTSRTTGAAGSTYDAMVAQDNARKQPK